jgi:hypothetical protein
MAKNTRNSRLAVVCETTEGVPVSPTVGTEYLPIQDDVSLNPELETLENSELKGSIGPAKSISGAEAPSGSFSIYMRNSGTEGTCPGVSPLLEASFGEEIVHGTERDTIAGSTVSAVNVDVGEGAEHIEGQAILVKDGANGYSIRPIETIAGDVLTPAIDLPAAPASGVNLGDACTYRPKDCDQKTFSVWDYRGNGACVQALAGGRVTNIAMTMNAGELINATYDFQGIAYYFNPLEVQAGVNDKLDFTDDGGAAVATISAKLYKTPKALADELETQMNAVSTDTITVSYGNSTGKYTIANTSGALFELDWSTGPNTATTIGGLIGFDTAADDTGSLSYEGDNAISLESPQTPDLSLFDDPLVAKNNELFIGDADSTTCIEASAVSFTLGTPVTDVLSICSESGKARSVINERTATMTVTALVEQYDCDFIERLLNNSDTRVVYNAGVKDGSGNWIPGRNWCLYMRTATVSSFSKEDLDGLVAVTIEIQSFVNDDSDGEVYLSFV